MTLPAERILVLTDALLTSLRSSDDLTTVQRRLALMDCLLPVLLSPGADESGLGPPDGPLGTLLLRCARSGPADYRWAAAACAAVGEPPTLLLARAADAPSRDPFYPRPMAAFRNSPDDYRWVPVADLPPAHNPFKCEHAKGWLHVASSARPWPRRLLRPGGRQDPGWPERLEADRWLEREHGRWCGKHKADLDWQAVLEEAERVHDRVRPWTRSAVTLAVNPSGREPFTPEIALLHSLFSDPVVWDGKSERVGNGQHRICGARQARAEHLLVSRS